jgi:26S proteasome regulatory subunit T5
MSTLEELDDLDRRDRDDKKDKKQDDKGKQGGGDGDAEMEDAEEEEDNVLDPEILSLSTEDIKTRRRLLENDARIMKSEFQRLSHEKATMAEKIKENMEKIANNRYVAPPCPRSRLWLGLLTSPPFVHADSFLT